MPKLKIFFKKKHLYLNKKINKKNLWLNFDIFIIIVFNLKFFKLYYQKLVDLNHKIKKKILPSLLTL